MDPNAALVELLDAIEVGDRGAAIEAAEILTGWLSRGGFMPRVDKNFNVNRIVEERGRTFTIYLGRGGR